MCASPLALQAHKIGAHKRLTSYPCLKDDLKSMYDYQDDTVVCDGNLITSRGPGTASFFALKIAEELVGATTAKEVADGMLIS